MKKIKSFDDAQAKLAEETKGNAKDASSNLIFELSIPELSDADLEKQAALTGTFENGLAAQAAKIAIQCRKHLQEREA